ncbi:MAG: RidA family protein [Gammaproteobacteria bacterium]|nr:RidA family protein [Gammaproteobacteria bacterium]
MRIDRWTLLRGWLLLAGFASPQVVAAGSSALKEIIIPDTVTRPAAPYASAIRVRAAGNLVFVAGVVSSDINGNILHKGDILEQTRQTVRNLILTLQAAGAKPENVVKTTTYVVSSAMKDFFATQAFLEALTPFNRPTDTLVGVASLAASEHGQLIEIDAIAVTE